MFVILPVPTQRIPRELREIVRPLACFQAKITTESDVLAMIDHLLTWQQSAVVSEYAEVQDFADDYDMSATEERWLDD